MITVAGTVLVTCHPRHTAMEPRCRLSVSSPVAAQQQSWHDPIGRAVVASRLHLWVLAAALCRRPSIWWAWGLRLLVVWPRYVHPWRHAMVHTSRWRMLRHADTNSPVTDHMWLMTGQLVLCSCNRAQDSVHVKSRLICLVVFTQYRLVVVWHATTAYQKFTVCPLLREPRPQVSQCILM